MRSLTSALQEVHQHDVLQGSEAEHRGCVGQINLNSLTDSDQAKICKDG